MYASYNTDYLKEYLIVFEVLGSFIAYRNTIK